MLVIIPPIIVCCQLSLEAIKAPVAIIQFQRRIRQRIGNAILSELRTNGPHNHSLWFRPLHNETANHHVVTCLHKAAGANVAEY